MHFTAPLILAIAALTTATPITSPDASPVANPIAFPQETLPPVQVPTCDQCKDQFEHCLRSWPCWFNPATCDTTCRAETCKASFYFCRDKCGWKCP